MACGLGALLVPAVSWGWREFEPPLSPLFFVCVEGGRSFGELRPGALAWSGPSCADERGLIGGGTRAACLSGDPVVRLGGY
ncbi:hypothetical protein NDU88_004213 [Pleurodeles waltl]|uniref:Secreted protein n=1 Tax=Pleurodeles waltl TaxID=8319 RepID=A0AAV7LHF6_PLEWA|nr:hypothetical protein NDU88_004213 [Pleurodeles waltl]